MPHYLIETRFTLSRPQQEEFAKSITKLHSVKFGTLPLFIRVHFESIDTAKGWRNIYVAGIKAGLNAVICDDLPTGDVEQYNELCWDIKNEWNRLFFKGREHSWMDEKYLRAVIMKGLLVRARQRIMCLSGMWYRNHEFGGRTYTTIGKRSQNCAPYRNIILTNT